MLRVLAVAAALAALALPAAAVAASHAGVVSRGVVQSIDPTHLVLRTLDGSVVTFDLTVGTGVRINGGPGTASDIAPDSWPRSWSTARAAPSSSVSSPLRA